MLCRILSGNAYFDLLYYVPVLGLFLYTIRSDNPKEKKYTIDQATCT